MIQEVFVFSLRGDELTVLDTENNREIKINVATYDKMECKNLIGKRILIEETETGFDFAGMSIFKLLTT